MDIKNLHLVWFSATATTKQIVGLIAEQFKSESTVKHDITKSSLSEDININPTDLLILGMPVYAGRIPSITIDTLNRFKGNNTPAVIACVYGNRDYDDALLEMKKILQKNGFIIVSAAAFIAQHSIFPEVGASRPDERDIEAIKVFGEKSNKLIASLDNTENLPDINIKGNYPHKKAGKVPLSPKVNRKCNKCGVCVNICPTDAIPTFNPKITFGGKCIACARCIAICPQQARHFGGIIYRIAAKLFVKKNLVRKEPEVVYIEL